MPLWRANSRSGTIVPWSDGGRSRGSREHLQRSVNCSWSRSSPPLLPPSPPPPDAMAGSVCLHYAAVEVCDRGAAGGESLDNASVKGARGTKPFDGGHRDQCDPRIDGGSTSPEIKTKDIRTGARLTSPRPPPGPGGHLATGVWRLASGGIWQLVASDDWHLAASDDISFTSISHSASPLEK